MLKYFLIVSLLLHISIQNNLHKTETSQSIDKVIENLFNLLGKERCEVNVSYKAFPHHETQYKGLYKSYIHMNALDEKNSEFSKLKRNYGIMDMNNFVTSMVIFSLFESLEYNQDKLSAEYISKIEESLDVIYSKFKDNNFEETTPIYGFWSQINVNGTWSQYPDNIEHLMLTNKWLLSIFDKPWVKKIFNFFNFNNILVDIDFLKLILDMYLNVFKIPADYDDTSINMALTGMIHKYNKNHNSTHFQSWISRNLDYEKLFEHLKYFAYKPFEMSSEKNNLNADYHYEDLLDSRTYFWIHDWLTEKNKLGEFDISLPTTWFMDLPLQKKYQKDVNMPFNVNNVDLNVVSNFVFGISNLFLFHNDKEYITKIFDTEIQNMYSNSIELLSFAIKNNFMNKRTDLILLYYPSIFDFYWLVSRVYSLSKNIPITKHNSFLTKHNNDLESIMKNEATSQILDRIIIENNNYYFVEFLGNNEHKKRNEDAIFATGLALNSLLNIWTHESRVDNITKLIYDDDCKEDLKETIDHIAEYLIKFSSDPKIIKENVFFSGSVKGESTYEYSYPSNFNQYFNGTDIIDVSKPLSNVIIVSGVKSYIDNSTFQEMKSKNYFGHKVPLDITPLNNSTFPYWSSPAVTYSFSLVSLSKYRAILK